MQKSADAFRTISEVAEELDVPQHVLRFWESKFTHIKPLKRAGGRRYYRPDDIALLRSIRGLLYNDGYTIKGVQKLLKERGARAISSSLVAGVSGQAHEAVADIAAPTDTVSATKPAARRRSVAPDPDELSLPFFMPDFLKPPVAATRTVKPAKTAEAPTIPPAQHRKLDKVLAELVAIQALLNTP